MVLIHKKIQKLCILGKRTFFLTKTYKAKIHASELVDLRILVFFPSDNKT